MAFETFNQGAVQSAYIGYKSYFTFDFDEQGDLILYWSNAGQLVPSNQLMAQFMDIKPLEIATVSIPSALQVGIGTNFIIYNSGTENLIIVDRTDPENITPINIIPPGNTFYYVLKQYDATLPDVRWESFNFASTTAAPIVANLAGYGLTVDLVHNDLMTLIDVDYVTDPVGITVSREDRSSFFIWETSSGPFNLSLLTKVKGWYCSLLNLGSGLITIEPPVGSLIDGEPSKSISLKQSLTIVSDGVNYFTLGYGQQQTDITIPLSIVNGGTNANNQAQAIKNLMPTAASSGQMVYYDGTNWLTFNRPISAGTQVLTNDSGGNLTWQFRWPLPAPGVNGNLLISNAGAWTILPPGAENEVLKIVGGIPTWSTP